MIIDTLNLFSDNQAVTVDAISTNVIDLLPGTILGTPTANLLRDIGAGKTLYWHCLITTTFTTGDAGVLTVTLESDSTANLATSATVHITAISIVAVGTLVAGFWIAKGIPLPPGDYERYLGVRYLTTTGNFTAGNVTSWVSENRMDDRAYRPGYVTGVN